MEALAREMPDAAHPSEGCNFHPRCPWAEQVCIDVDPALVDLQTAHRAACHVAAREFSDVPAPLPDAGERA